MPDMAVVFYRIRIGDWNITALRKGAFVFRPAKVKKSFSHHSPNQHNFYSPLGFRLEHRTKVTFSDKKNDVLIKTLKDRLVIPLFVDDPRQS
jgi:hypothetical protein